MIWIILTFVFGWLLCGAWAIRMVEKWESSVGEDRWFFLALYATGPIGVMTCWLRIWPTRLGEFAKGIISAWKQAKNK